VILNELDKIAYYLYEKEMWSEFYLVYNNIDRFVKLKEGYTCFYDDAKRILRKKKLKKLKNKKKYENFKKK
jgi:hypothetical protein